ncbi:ankyrin repeat domain-containing protein [Pelagibacteraceae bacterium]|nr:ankyrin repeat domain-containing protein [Pelagibacteraceae bacterium]
MSRKTPVKRNLRKTRSKKQGGAKMPYVGRYYENPNAKLWDGVYKNNYKKVEEAFKEGADVNMKNDNGVWFLLVASGHGNARMVNLLLEKGIDVNITDEFDYNNTALSTAVMNAKYDVVELLLEKGADINKENNNGDTPLMHAIRFEDYDMVEFLLEHPDINIELDVDTNKELRLAEELTPEDEEQNGIPYLIEDHILTKNEIKKQKDDNIKELSNYKRDNIPSLSTLAYQQTPSAVNEYLNLNPYTINRPHGKLGGKRRTLKFKRPKKTNKTRTRSSKKHRTRV